MTEFLAGLWHLRYVIAVLTVAGVSACLTFRSDT